MKKLTPESQTAILNTLGKVRKQVAEDYKSWHGRAPAPAFYSDEKAAEVILYAMHFQLATMHGINFDRSFIIDSLNYGNFLSLDTSARLALIILAGS